MTTNRRVILLIETSRGYGRALLSGIARYSRLHGPWNFYRMRPFYLEQRWSRRKKDFAQLHQWRPDGVIMRETPLLDDILSLKVPTIVSLYDRPHISNVAEIYVDNVAIGRMAATHLIDAGFQQFAFCGYDCFFWSQQRGQGFTECLNERGFSCHLYCQPRSSTGRLWSTEQHRLADWLKELPKPIGLMACIDERSQDVVEACRLAGVRIPEEIALIGGDNDDLICELSNPPLSSVAVSGESAGFQAAVLLEKLMSGEPTKENIVRVEPTHVAIRQSTDVLAITDDQVAKSLHFIRQNQKQNISVTNVVEATDISRCALERRFRQALHRSIHNEIRRVRVDAIIRLLQESELSITQIAHAMGFSGVHHIARYFRSEKGLSLQAYRQQFRL